MASPLRVESVVVLALAPITLVACQATPGAARQAAFSAHAEPVERTTAVAPAPWPSLVALTHGEYEKRLAEDSIQCEQSDLGRLDGQWIVLDSPRYPAVSEVWMCQGHIRWRGDMRHLNDICMSRLAEVPGGLNAEGTWHEDFHDASGLYVRLREADQRLIVDVSTWDAAPPTFSTFFSLVRSDSAQGYQPCPLELSALPAGTALD